MRYAKPIWLNSLTTRVLLAYVAAVIMSIVLIVLVVVAIVVSQGDFLSGTDVAGVTEDMAGFLQFDRSGVPTGFDGGEGDQFAWISESLKDEAAYRVLDASGKVVLVSAAGEAFWPQSGPASRLERSRFDFEHEGVAMRAATERLEHDGKAYFLQNAVSTRFLNLSYRAFALPFTVAGITSFSLILLVAFGSCAYVTLKVSLRPLRRISESAAAISERSLHARLQIQAVPSEIAPLVESFNRVLDRLQQGYRIQREFLATAAHELKTPLALIRAQIEMTADTEDRTFLLDDVEHMTRQVQQLLMLAEASELQSYRFSSVEVQEVVQEAVGYLQRKADAAEVRLVSLDGAAAAQWRADRRALFTLLKNLLENAIEHAPRGSCVVVELGPQAVAVRDWGPGVEQEQLSQIFLRFWRGPHRRDLGAGLGLAICQEIALAHGWKLLAQGANPGLRLSLSLSAK